MECSFCIWLARNSKEWTSTTNLKGKDSLKESCNSTSPRPYSKQNINPVPKANSICPIDFINKGNTCYANSILQVLSVICLHYIPVPSESNHLSPMFRAISFNMAVKRNSTKPIDPSNFMGLKTQFVKHKSNTFQLQIQTRCGRDTASCFR